MPHTHAAHTDRHDDQPGWSDAAAADLLDLDGAVLRAYWTDVLAWVRRVAGTTGRLRVLDLGAGTGTGAIGLAETGADVEVVAVDSSAVALERIRAKALALGIADRVSTIEADLDQGWPADLVDLDLTWASMSLHHLADPDHVLRDIHTATRPGGVVAVAEFRERPRFLPDQLGDGFEQRLNDALTEEHVRSMPTLGAEWAGHLRAAGFEIEAEREFVIDARPAESPELVHYAQAWFGRLAGGVAERLEPRDRTTLTELLDEHRPESLARRDDLHLLGSRTVTIGRRPA